MSGTSEVMAWLNQDRTIGGRPTSVVCGRRFCPMCGRWRHIADFPVDFTPDGVVRGFRGACETCGRIRRRNASATDESLARRRDLRGGAPRDRLMAPCAPFTEAVRAWMRRQEIEAGGPLVRQYHTQRGGEDRGYTVAGLDQLADLARIHPDQLRAIKNGRKQYIELPVADRLALALDIPLPLLAEDFLTMAELRWREQRAMMA